MYRSKARVTQEQADEIVRRYKEARSTPVMMIGGVDVAGSAWRGFLDHLDEVARGLGLKDQPGEWGFDQETRQFLSAYPIEEEEHAEV